MTASPLHIAQQRADQLLGPERVTATDLSLRLDVDAESAGRINRELVNAGVEVTELRWVERTLEEVFLQMTNQKGDDGDS
ncbi:MAG: hypothetical protein WKH64_10870 [Chloroflexia bacterium]